MIGKLVARESGTFSLNLFVLMFVVVVFVVALVFIFVGEEVFR